MYVHGDAWPEDPVKIAATWRRAFFGGRVGAVDWLMTRTCRVDLGGSGSVQGPLGREGVLAFSRVFSRAFPNASWRVPRVEQREHEVLVDASFSARHEGPLDLTPFGGREHAPTGRCFVLPFQRFAWDIVHKRVHRVEVVEGPGLGLDLIVRLLELEEGSPQAEEKASKHRVETSPEVEPVVRFQPRSFALPRPAGGANGGSHGAGSNGNGSKRNGSAKKNGKRNGSNGSNGRPKVNGNGSNGGQSASGNGSKRKGSRKRRRDQEARDLRERIDQAIRERTDQRDEA